jgi:hypothetical protein
MLGGVVSLCSLAMCLRTISEYRKRSPQNAAMPLVAGEDVRTPLGAFRVVFRMGHFQILCDASLRVAVAQKADHALAMLPAAATM